MKINKRKIVIILMTLLMAFTLMKTNMVNASTKEAIGEQKNLDENNVVDTYKLIEKPEIKSGGYIESNEIDTVGEEKDITPKTGDTSYITPIIAITFFSGISLILLKRYTKVYSQKE